MIFLANSKMILPVNWGDTCIVVFAASIEDSIFDSDGAGKG